MDTPFILYVIIITLLLSISAYAQRYHLICSYAGGSAGSGLAPAGKRALMDVAIVTDILGIPPLPIYKGGVLNAGAAMTPMGPIIVYNPIFFEDLFRNVGTFAPLSIIAHEVGHHYNGDTSAFGRFRDSWSKELKADYISGYVLGQMNISWRKTRVALLDNFNLRGSKSHPDTLLRLDALKKGWKSGRRRR